MASATKTKTSKPANPLLQDWKTPFKVPPFEAIEPAHFLPAFEMAMAEHRAEIDKIAAAASKATFKNTIVALEDAGRLLGHVSGTFWNLTGAHTNDALQAIERLARPVSGEAIVHVGTIKRGVAVADARTSTERAR